MATDTIDYAAVLADLEAKREALDSAIAAIRLMAGLGPIQAPAAAAAGPELDAREIPSGAFHSRAPARKPGENRARRVRRRSRSYR